MQKATVVTLGESIILRKPTEAEVLALENKRLSASIRQKGLRDHCDDGDYEVMALVMSHDPAQVAEIIKEAPMAIEAWELAIRELGQADVVLTPDPAAAKAKRAEDKSHYYLAYTLEMPAKAHEATNLPYQVSIVLRKRTQIEIKFWKSQYKGFVPPEVLAQDAKDRVVYSLPEEIWDEYPWLSLTLAMKLNMAARGQEESAAGK